MSEPQIEATATWITAHCEGATLERSALTVTQLCEMAPLLLTCGDDTVAGESGEPPPVAVAAKEVGS